METQKISSEKRKELQVAIRCILVFSAIATVLVLGAGLSTSSTFKFLLLLVTGWLGWTFTEYFLHRFWMHNHFRNVNSKIYDMHMNHHKHPQQIKIDGTQRSILLIVGIVLFYFALIWNNYFTLFLGYYFGGTLYSLLHIMLHKPWGKYVFPKVQKAHIHHHGKYPDRGFSFSTIIWDWMFDTLPPKEENITEKMLKFYFKHDIEQRQKK
jgi:dihydroceramide fatty acyl 2-hydroxylase